VSKKAIEGLRKISLSLPETTLEQVDAMQEEMGAVSRSEVIRWLIFQKFQELQKEGT